MIRLLFFKIFLQNGSFFYVYPFFYLAPFWILFPALIDIWLVSSILFMQRCLVHPLGVQKRLTTIVYLSNYPVSFFLRFFNLFIALTINLCSTTLLAILVFFLEKISMQDAISTLLLANILLFIGFTLGNRLELSDFSTIKISFVKKIIGNFLLSLTISATFLIYFLLSFLFNDYKLYILSGLLASALLVWHISLNINNKIKYFHYL